MNTQRTAASRRYTVRFPAAMAVYAMLIVLVIPIVKGDGPMWSKVLLVLVPLIPVLYALSECLRFIRSLDEFQIRLQFEAVGISAAVTAVFCFAWGLLEIAGAPKLPVVMVLPMFCMSYGIGLMLACRRYR